MDKQDKKIYDRIYYKKNRKKIREYNRKYYEKNAEKIKKQVNNYRIANLKRINIKKKRYREKNKQKIKEHDKKYYEDNKNKITKKGKEYYEKNKDKVMEYQRKNKDKIYKWRNKHDKNRRKTDKNFNIICRLRYRVRLALNKYTKTGKIMASKKYGIDFGKIIENLKPFPEDLSKYHIDHIKPICSFNFINKDGSQNLEEIKKAFAPKNYQWLLASENFSKADKIENIK